MKPDDPWMPTKAQLAYNSTCLPPSPLAWLPWERLYKIAPDLRDMHETFTNQKPPPQPMNDELFVALAACFADPIKRRVLAALVLDVIGDELVELIQEAISQKE